MAIEISNQHAKINTLCKGNTACIASVYDFSTDSHEGIIKPQPNNINPHHLHQTQAPRRSDRHKFE